MKESPETKVFYLFIYFYSIFFYGAINEATNKTNNTE